MTKENNRTAFIPNYLSIQIGFDGLALSVYDAVRGAIVETQSVVFGCTLDKQEIPSRLEAFLNETRVKHQGFSNVIVVHKNRLSTFVPRDLFIEKHVETYLKYNVKIEETPFYEDMIGTPLCNVFSPHGGVSSYLENIYGSIKHRHYSTVLFQDIFRLFQLDYSTNVLIELSEHEFLISVISKGELVFYNTFLAESLKDFSYYLQYISKLLEINTKKIPLYFIGDTDNNNPYFQEGQKIFKTVDTLKIEVKSTIANKVQKDFLKKYYVLLNSFQR